MRRGLIGAGAAIALSGAIAMICLLPASAAAQEAEASTCSPAPAHTSALEESGTSCTKARKVAKHAVKVKNSYSWTYAGFACHGVASLYGQPPISFTCKKGEARIYFTYS